MNNALITCGDNYIWHDIEECEKLPIMILCAQSLWFVAGPLNLIGDWRMLY